MNCKRCHLFLEPGEHHLTAERCVEDLRAALAVALNECRRLRRLADPTVVSDEEIRFWERLEAAESQG